MDQSTSVVGLDAQGNMVFTVVKPVMGIFQMSAEHTNSLDQGAVELHNLPQSSMGLVQGQTQPTNRLGQGAVVLPDLQQPSMGLAQGQGQQGGDVLAQPQIHPQSRPVPSGDAAPGQDNRDATQSQNNNVGASSLNPDHVCHVPFAEVSSLLDPNMKGSKARKHLISYDEIKRRLQAPEKMSLRSLAAYTRVSRGPASKKTLLESLNILGLTPSTTTAVSSSFSKLTEGDTRALCADMKDFAYDYMDYGKIAKQLIPETNTVQHWSKIIETKSHLEEMRKCFKDPINSGLFDSVTHGLGLGMVDAALDIISEVIDRQVRILSGAAASDPADSGLPKRRIRRRHRKPSSTENDKPHRAPGGVKGHGKVMAKGKGTRKDRKKAKTNTESLLPTDTSVPMETSVSMNIHPEQRQPENVESSVLTLVSVGYDTITSGLNTSGTV
ncbi:uncharacterized protein FYW47_015233 [Aplochiton taeniatus]